MCVVVFHYGVNLLFPNDSCRNKQRPLKGGQANVVYSGLALFSKGVKPLLEFDRDSRAGRGVEERKSVR